ncbi:hypothetical protein KTE62_21355 [Burkholderia multivorans]|uniref:hypothetical protein n=1 Tax=Burkholderia multivorans TaxID=87883 RepID=UPI001C226C14|nr:hypothetical protein [Burkholderia multivorans]MBU9444262.1 hypothetical protein [Burkholderia multivorans]
MRNGTAYRTITQEKVVLETWPARYSSTTRPEDIATHIVGVARTGGAYAAALYYRSDVTASIASEHLTTVDDLEADGIVGDSKPFRDARTVIVIAAPDEPRVLDIAAIVAENARMTGSCVVAMLPQPPGGPEISARAAARSLVEPAHVVVFVPETAHPDVLQNLIDLHVLTIQGLLPGASELKTPVGAEFLDVREAFAGATGAAMGVGTSNSPALIHDATNEAISYLRIDRLFKASGVLIVVAGGESLRVKDIATAIYTILNQTSGAARVALAVHYDDRFGAAVRVSIIVGERGG